MKGQTNKSIQHHKTQRALRNRMTDAELRLWRHLRSRQMNGFKFRRQHPFDSYILDFVCLEAMLVIEVDGGQHAIDIESDATRAKHLEKAGFKVLRFWNNEVLLQIEAVKEKIFAALANAPSPPRSSP